MTRLRLEAVECFERDVQAAPAVPLRRHHRDAGHPGRDPRHHRAGGRPHQRRCRGRDPGRQVVRQEPGFQRRAEPRPAAPVPGARHRSLSRARAGARRLASTPVPMPSSRRAGRTSGWCRWWPPMARRCSTAPSSMRWAAPQGLSFAEMIRRNVAGHRRNRADARPRRLRPAALPGRPAARPRHRRAPHGGPRRSHRRRRPEAGRARRRRPAGDAGGGRRATTAAATTS